MKTLKIEGMSCAHCAAAVTKALNAISGVSSAKVDLESKTASIEMNETISIETLRAAIENAGFDIVD